MIELTAEQRRAYDRFIKARDKVRIGTYGRGGKDPFVPLSDVKSVVDIAGFNHPFYEQNDDWIEYKEASLSWWEIEPAFRHEERMRASRGDYGIEDSWEDEAPEVNDLYQFFKEE